MDTTTLKNEIRELLKEEYEERLSLYLSRIPIRHQASASKQFESNFKLRTKKAAERFIELGLLEDHHISAEWAGFNIFINASDQSGVYNSRLIFCAEDSYKVKPHWRLVTTKTKE